MVTWNGQAFVIPLAELCTCPFHLLIFIF